MSDDLHSIPCHIDQVYDTFMGLSVPFEPDNLVLIQFNFNEKGDQDIVQKCIFRVPQKNKVILVK